jgi:hypothetical protein
MGDWLSESILAGNAERKIRTLRLEDLDAMATAAISGWVCARAKQEENMPGDYETQALLEG